MGQGTGLGLSVCHGIVTALGGEIAIESAVRQGTSVRVTLEVADRRDQPPISVRPPSRGRRARILAIDDDILLLEAIRRVLEEEHEVVTVTSGQEALDRLTAGESFDLIVCDVVMPGITGVDFYAKVAASMPAVARSIVLLTAGAVTQTMASLLDRSRAPVLTKPFDPKELLAFVRRRIGN